MASRENTQREDAAVFANTPVGIQNKSDSGETEPVSVERKSVSLDAELVIAEMEQVSAETEPIRAKNEPTSAETEPVSAETEPVSVETGPVIAKTEPACFETEPVSVETGPVMAETEPVSAETEPVITKTETILADTNPDVSQTEPVITKTETILADTNPDIAQTEPDIDDNSAGVANKTVCIYEEECKLYEHARNELLISKAKEIQEKMVITKNILQACQFEQRTPGGTVSLMKLHHDTNLQYDYLVRLTNDNTQTKQTEMAYLIDGLDARSMTRAIKETRPIPLSVLPFIHGDIRDVFVEYYVEKKELPSRTDFLCSLQNKRHSIYFRDNMYYKTVTIRTLVKNNLVEHHHFPGIKRYMITENPKFMYKRHIYLSQIMKHRKEEKPIVYVTIKRIYNVTDKRSSFLLLAASSTAGLIAKHDPFEHDDKNVPLIQAKQWIQNQVVPNLKLGTVVVLTQPPVINTIPTPYSTTDCIKAWLLEHDIPFDNDEDKASLYSLVKIFQKQCKDKGLYEEIIANYGFEVVICPPEYEKLDYFAGIYDHMRKSIVGAKVLYVRLFRMILKLSDVEWAQMENQLIEEERRMIEEDNEMDKIVENIFQMVKNGHAKECDFPYTCSGTKIDNFMVHIGDIIAD